MKILIVEDEPKTGEYLRQGLSEAGYVADLVPNGTDGLHMALHGAYDLVILDVMLPGLNGWQVLQSLRERGLQMPVLFLTARDQVEDRVKGLELGADDYLVKPFAGAELLARCQALTVRHRSGETHVLRIGTLRIDRRQGQAARQDRPLDLHQTAYQILLALAEAWPRTLTRSEMIQRLWGDAPPDSDPLRTHLYLLRQALDKPFATPMLKTVHGVGFRLQADA